MNKVFYFTVAQEQNLFKNNLSNWRVAPNMSNQNFHNKLIRSIGKTHNVEVISLRPINDNYKDSILKYQKIKNDRVTWHHIKVKKSKIDKFLLVNGRVNKLLSSFEIDKNDVIIVDTMNYRLLKLAYDFGKKKGLKVIGLCTDNPYNISYTSKSKNDDLLAIGQKLDGYIALTPKLNELYNINHKPYLLIDGICEIRDYLPRNEIDTNYIFYGGCLMKKYGLYNLVEAFNELKLDKTKLVICGHHEESDFASLINQNKNIIYLGAVDSDRIYALEKYALMAVNPRPIDPNIDEYSIPSKTLEYLAFGVLTISVDNSLLKEKYNDAIIWTKNNDVNSLKEAILKALSLDKNEKDKMIKLGQELIKENASFKAVNNKIDSLLLEMGLN